ncbi:hypothetical protein NECID01_1080 [Nematocida sp. AWRm77]|nr:hypothetical protein NECID01_1080 [Nematocida sp. AWRm77]
MENSLLETLAVSQIECLFVSGEYVCTPHGITEKEGRECVLPLPKETLPDSLLGFYSEGKGEEFKLVTDKGDIFRSRKAEKYNWEKVGEMEDARVLGCAFNPGNGNLLLCTDTKVFLIDKHINLVKQVDLRKDVQEDTVQEGCRKATASWSEDGKYILLHTGSVVLVYRYDLQEISDTISTCNRIMNSRLVRTKKYLMHESSYIDVSRRASALEEHETEAEAENTPEAGNVLFEERTRYKAAHWHNQFSLIYAVSEDNRVYLLERNGFKFKEIKYVCEASRAKEHFQETSLVCLASHKDYLYLLHKNQETLHFKVYYIKNNTVYLKSSKDLNMLLQCRSIPGRPTVSIHEGGSTVEIATQKGHVSFFHARVLNRTDSDVVCIDGAAALLSTFAKHLIPPPLYTRHVALESVPEMLVCTADAIEYRTRPSRENASSKHSLQSLPPGLLQAEHPVPAKEIEESLSTLALSVSSASPGALKVPQQEAEKDLHMFYNMPYNYRSGACTEKTISLGQTAVCFTMDRTNLTIRARAPANGNAKEESTTLRNVTSMALLVLSETHVLVSQSCLSWTTVSRITADPSTRSFVVAPVCKTGKDCTLLFACPSYIVLSTEHGTLETFYPDLIVEHQMVQWAEKGCLEKSVFLAKKHGVSLHSVSFHVLEVLHRESIAPSLLLDITKQILSSSVSVAENSLPHIEQYALKALLKIREGVDVDVDVDVGEVGVDVGVRKSLFRQVSPKEALASGRLNVSDLHSPRRDTKDVKEMKETVTLCAVLVEIFLAQKEHALIVSLAQAFTPSVPFSPFLFSVESQSSAALSVIERVLSVVSREEILQLCLDKHAYTLCYLVLAVADMPQDEINDLLLLENTSEINPQNAEEEVARRCKIFAYLKNRKKQVIYTIMHHLIRHGKEDACTPEELAQSTILQMDKLRIRDYYTYLLEEDALESPDSLFAASRDAYCKVVHAMLLQAGSTLQKEGEPQEALQCYIGAGSMGTACADALRVKLGLWKDLFSTPANLTLANILRVETVLLSTQKIKEVAEMHIAYGDPQKGAEYLVKAEEYAFLLACLKEGRVVLTQSLADYLIQQTSTHTETLRACTDKYRDNQNRLKGVRARKDKEREEILQSMYTDNDNETVSCSKSFITNSFMSGISGKKKKRTSKLRNTPGGRYEEEYVQYVLSELILRAVQLVQYTQYMEEMFASTSRIAAPGISTSSSMNTNGSTSVEKSLFFKSVSLFYSALCGLWSVASPSIRTDFLSQNTEEDPLYDPERPCILPPSPEHIAYIEDLLEKHK